MHGTSDFVRTWRVTTVSLALLATGAALAQTGDGGGVLAYTWQPSAPGGLHRIHVTNADGTGDRLLIDASIGLNHHEWSPDARRIAAVGYLGTDNATWSIHVVDAEGGGLQRLTTADDVWDSEPTWSPDGTRLAFNRIFPAAGFRCEMWVMDADGGDQHWIGQLGFAPKWSPDGARFVYQTSLFGGVPDIQTCRIDGGDVRVLHASPASDRNPVWSPDGAKIAFVTSAGEDPNTYEIWVMNADGTGDVQLTDNAVYDDMPRWSPDGSLLAFHTDRSGDVEIHVMNADGTDVRRVTTMPAGVTAINPSWCPSLSGPYLGQAAPGEALERFPPFPYLANAGWFWHGAPVCSPDGREMYFTRYDRENNRTGIFMTEVVDGVWTWPRRADFSSGTDADNCPVFSATGDSLYFESMRPGGSVFLVERSGNSWSSPRPLALAMPSGASPARQFSVARNGDVYGELWVDGGGDLDLFRWRLVGGDYAAPEDLGPTVNSDAFDFMPYVDPRQRFLIFASERPGGLGMSDIWICARAADGGWNSPTNAGPAVNTGDTDVWPFLSPDASLFFVTSGHADDQGFNPYWVQAETVLSGIVSAENRSLGSVKALFR